MTNKYYKKIEEYLMNRPGQYIPIDDLRIDLLAPRRPGLTMFDRAWQDLAAGGRVEICGNSIRINQ